MPEPTSIGALVAATLAAGAVEAGKATFGEAAKDAYEKLKSFAVRLIGPSVAELEAKPSSVPRAGVVAEKVDEQAVADKTELKALAEALREALVAEDRGVLLDNQIMRINVFADRGGIAAGGNLSVGTVNYTPPKISQ